MARELVPPGAEAPPRAGPRRAAGKRIFGATWWGKAWIAALEQRARLDPNRLPRGRTYARTGAVGELEVRTGEIVASVQGSRAEPYKVTVRVRTYAQDEWDRVLGALANQVGHLAALLDGEMPPGVVEDLADARIDLLPVAGEVQPRCSCPDWADPCKHSAAVCYLVADTLDADPFLLFLMRGRDRDSLLAGLRARRSLGQAPVGPVPATGPGPATSGVVDTGLNAQQVWARWATVSAGGVPPVPAVPLPAAKHGRPTVLAVDPPPGSGVTSEGLQRLAADAAQRAWEMAHGERSTGLESPAPANRRRRAAAMLGPGGRQEDILQLATSAGVPVRDLLNQALAWREGGSEGLFVLLEEWDAPRNLIDNGRALLGGRATVRRNRATLGGRQLRLGRDGRWYPYRRSGRGAASGTWVPDGAPIEGTPPVDI